VSRIEQSGMMLRRPKSPMKEEEEAFE